jgi:hypothetical protein
MKHILFLTFLTIQNFLTYGFSWINEVEITTGIHLPADEESHVSKGGSFRYD